MKTISITMKDGVVKTYDNVTSYSDLNCKINKFFIVAQTNLTITTITHLILEDITSATIVTTP